MRLEQVAFAQYSSPARGRPLIFRRAVDRRPASSPARSEPSSLDHNSLLLLLRAPGKSIPPLEQYQLAQPLQPTDCPSASSRGRAGPLPSLRRPPSLRPTASSQHRQLLQQLLPPHPPCRRPETLGATSDRQWHRMQRHGAHQKPPVRPSLPYPGPLSPLVCSQNPFHPSRSPTLQLSLCASLPAW